MLLPTIVHGRIPSCDLNYNRRISPYRVVQFVRLSLTRLVVRLVGRSVSRSVGRSVVDSLLVNHPPFSCNFMLNFRHRAPAACSAFPVCAVSYIFLLSSLPDSLLLPLSFSFFLVEPAEQRSSARFRRFYCLFLFPLSVPFSSSPCPLPAPLSAPLSCRSVFNSSPTLRAPAPDCLGR